MTLKTALIQLTSTADMAENIARVEAFVAQAAGEGAELVALPENAFYMRAEREAPASKYTQAEHPGVKASAAMAKQHGVWLLAGSVAVTPSLRASDSERGNPDWIASSPAASRNGGKTFNRSLLFNPEGNIVAQYDKIHLFDVDIGDGQSYRESARFLAGTQAVTAKLPHCKLGMTVCYDLRFPQLYRALAKRGANVLAVPSAFTQTTGEAHWHVLLRSRAIENACFVIAPAQTGEHPGGRKTYGHSLIVDPWGGVLADGGTEEGILVADLDMEEVKRVRTRLPSLEHDQEFT